MSISTSSLPMSLENPEPEGDSREISFPKEFSIALKASSFQK
jgi:hypothetical protein